MKFYPRHTLLLEDTLLLRDRLLPHDVRGEVQVEEGDIVNPTDVIALGTRPSDYVIIDMAGALGLEPDSNELLNMITIQEGQTLEAGTPLGEAKKRSYRRRMPKAPANSVVSLIDQGRVILQVNPEVIQVQARLSGTIREVFPERGATIESRGTLIQCAWGNGQYKSALYDFEPGAANATSEFSGLADLINLDISLSPYRGKAVILTRPLVEQDLGIIIAQELAGIVAPTAAPDLRKKAMQLKVPVILTEGFGSLPPTMRLYDMLIERRNTLAIFDAAVPDFHNNVRPEIIIPGIAARQKISLPNTSSPLELGMTVRLRRAPYAGQVGIITNLPELPIQIENGLRVSCAQVRLQTGERVMVPYANLESLGE